VIFDGIQARKGYALNKMCFLQRRRQPPGLPARRGRLLRAVRPEPAAARSHPRAQRAAADRAGGNAYYLAKFAGIFGLDMQDIGAQQTGMTKDQFKAKLVAARG
jgi:protocatechuate 4,5-dioxygenase alpha chain